MPDSKLKIQHMKSSSIFLAVFSLLMLVGCKEEKEKPKVIYDNPSKSKTNATKIDTTQITIADLPILISGTEYLLHPVGDLRVYDKARSAASGGSDVSYTISNYSEFEIAGYFRNLKFQKIGSDSIKSLTDRPLMIQTVTYLKSISDKLKHQYLLFTVSDMDTNKDGRLDAADIKSMYISDVDGGNFTKVSSDFEELIDWKIMDGINQLYFRTIEDTNKNGEFDQKDVVHYNVVNFTAAEYKVAPYNPI